MRPGSRGPVGRLDGKIALITGTAGGQGRAAALLFAREGAKIVGCDLNPKGAQETVEMVRAAGSEMTSMAPVDLSSEEQAARWVEDAVAVYGGIDILYNNAATARLGPLDSLAVESWRFTLRNDLEPVFLVTRAAWPHLVARGGGAIVNTASVMAFRADDMPMGAHGAAKAGVVALTVHMAVEGGPVGIRANTISPGLIATAPIVEFLKDPYDGMHKHVRASPLGRIGRAEDVAPVALFLASDEAAYVTGVNVVVDGGQTLGIGMQFGRDPRPQSGSAGPEAAPGQPRTIRTPDGEADALLFEPLGKGPGPWPGVLLYPDIMGVRPVFRAIAQRLADAGFVVLLPNLYYRSTKPFDPPLSVHNSGEFGRLFSLSHTIGRPEIERDSGAYLAALRAEPSVAAGPMGCVGFCMSAAMAIWSAHAHPEMQVGALAAIHGGHLVGSAPDSPAALAAGLPATLYFAMAETDAFMTPDMIARLRSTLDAAGARYQADVFAGAYHGFAVPDASYHEEAAEQAWARMTSILGEALSQG